MGRRGPTSWLTFLFARCRAVLRQEPILNENTRSSFVVDVEVGRVDYLVGAMGGSGKWRTFWMEDRQVVKQ